jgi:BirA family biotin operon repressor/biotin-[acetyl-CoA-carboxylase] ligase
MPVAHWPRLTLAAGVAAAEAAEAATGLPAAIKWPNDVLLAGRKTAGILVESATGPDAHVVVGIGLNVNQGAFPPPLDETATSLRIAAGTPFDRHEVAALLLEHLARRVADAELAFDAILRAASDRNALRDQAVEFELDGRTLRGVAGDLGPDGALEIRASDGALLRVASGEVLRLHAT